MVTVPTEKGYFFMGSISAAVFIFLTLSALQPPISSPNFYLI